MGVLSSTPYFFGALQAHGRCAILAEASRLNSKPLTAKYAKNNSRRALSGNSLLRPSRVFFTTFAVKSFSRDKIPAQLFRAYADHDCVTARD
jgi:hypothetical protein